MLASEMRCTLRPLHRPGRCPAARPPTAGSPPRRRPPACAAQQQPAAEVIVVGAGVAGLNCAAKLRAAGVPALVLEATDGVGGRVRTDRVDGFLLDRGFQIFLTSYPEAREALDYAALDLRPFYAGALVRWQGRFHRVADPFRHPLDGLASLPNPVGSPVDKLRVGLFRLKSLLGSVDELLQAPEVPTLQRLHQEGFSEAIIDRFFRPFLGGIFFDRSLGTSSRLFAFVMRMLATGQNCLPAAGIGAVAEQLAARLPPGSIRLGTRVVGVAAAQEEGGPASVALEDGSTLSARAVVVAVDGPEAERIAGGALARAPSKAAPGVGTCCLYFGAPRPAMPGGVLYLDGDGRGGVVNNMCFLSEVAPSYAPPGQALVSVSTIGALPGLADDELEARVRSEMAEWFGAEQVGSWRHLRTYRIPFAQPNQAPPTDFFLPCSLGGGLYVAGDHRAGATLDAALRSGRVAAEQVVRQLAAAPSAAATNAAPGGP